MTQGKAFHLTQLDRRNDQILSSSRGHGGWKDFLSHVIDFRSAEPIRMAPTLPTKYHPIPLDEWWDVEPVFSYEGRGHTRKKIVLSAANKDGGAHVDPELEPYYEFLCSGKYAFGFTGDLTYDRKPPFEQGVTHYAKNAHLALLRQFAEEARATAIRFAWDK